MRARLALRVSGLALEVREIVLKNKPQEMLSLSSKGTVPVLQLNEDSEPKAVVIDESFDIMMWALGQSDPEHWLAVWGHDSQALVETNDQVFKTHLDHYKYADRFPEQGAEVYRQRGEVFLSELEACLITHSGAERRGYLMGSSLSLADMAIFPFIRQFAQVDKVWFDQSPYPTLIDWLNELLETDIFSSIMVKLTPWQSGDRPVLFHQG